MDIKILYESEFPYDCHTKGVKDGVVVLPVNLQGLMEFGADFRRFKHEFPQTYRQYVIDCVVGRVFSGGIQTYEEKGQRIALLFYKMFEIGNHGENIKRMEMNLCKCIEGLLLYYPEGTKFYSSSIPFDSTKKLIIENKKKFTWAVLVDEVSK